MDSKKPLYKSIPFWIMVLFLLYSALGFFAVPYLIKKELSSRASSQLNSNIKVDKVSFNPFTIATSIEDVKLFDNDKTKWFSAHSIYANINLIDTVFNNISISEISIDSPYFNLVTENTKGDTTVKYPKITTTIEKGGNNDELLLDIETISIQKGSIDYNDKTGNKQLNLNLKEIIFKNQQFTTKNKDSKFDLTFITENDESGHINGKVNIAKPSFDINWSLENWKTATIFNFMTDDSNQLMGFKNEAGTINANGTVTHSGFDGISPSLVVKSLTLSDFLSSDDATIQPKVSIPELSVSTVTVDLDKQFIGITEIIVNDADIALAFNDDMAVTMKKKQSNNSDKETTHTDSNWTYKIKNIVTNNSLIHINKESENLIKLTKTTVHNITNIGQQKADINIDMLVDNSGTVKINGKLLSEPLDLSADIAINKLNIAKWNSWTPNHIKLTSETGLLSLHQNLAIKDSGILSEGWIKLNQLSLLDSDNQQFLKVNQLDLQDSFIDTNSKTIKLNNIKIDQADGTIAVSADKQLNLKNLVDSDETEGSRNNKSEDNDWIIEINEIELTESKTSFNDKSIKPNYQTKLSKINGKIKGLSSTNLSKADVNIKALLDTYAKIDISGQINPLSEKAFTDISVDIKDLSLQNFNSYSAKYLGFPITRGKADLAFNYKLNQSLLKGLNDLEFKQLKFGSKNQSKDAVGLPLKLAVSLLTDGKGIMKINLPVSGNIDDPDFKYGALVFKAFFKLITGIVASPFKILGKLVPGGADLDLSGIQFKVGSVELSDDEVDKLDAMSKIIQKRPDIILELTGVSNSVNDLKAIQQKQLLEQLGKDEAPNFSDQESLKSVEKLYIKTFSKVKWQQLTSKATKEKIINTQLLTENAWNELLSAQITDGKLLLLAKQRAEFIQKQLIEEYSVPADKVFLKPNEQSEELYPQVKFGVGN